MMSKDVVTLEEGQRLEFVEQSMRALRFRHMPVVDQGRLVGLISHRDVLRLSASSLLPEGQQQTKYLSKKFVVRDVMTRNVATVHPDTPLLEVASLVAADQRASRAYRRKSCGDALSRRSFLRCLCCTRSAGIEWSAR